MRTDPDQLAALAAVISEGSFDAAARALTITPSAVSQRIKALEQQVGQIVVRRTKPCTATESGQALVRLAHQYALLESETLTLIRGSSDAAMPSRIPVVVNADSLASWFLPAIAEQATTIGTLFDLSAEDQDHSAALLRDGSVMAAVTTEPIAIQGCRSQKLGSMRYLPVAAPGFVDRYLSGDTFADSMAVAPMLRFNRKDALQDQFLRKITRRRLNPPVHYIPSSWDFVTAVVLGLGWGMVPEQVAEEDLASGRLINIGDGKYLDVALYWQHWRLESPALSALTDAVTAAAGKALR